MKPCGTSLCRLLCMIMVVLALTACGSEERTSPTAAVVTSIAASPTAEATFVSTTTPVATPTLAASVTSTSGSPATTVPSGGETDYYTFIAEHTLILGRVSLKIAGLMARVEADPSVLNDEEWIEANIAAAQQLEDEARLILAFPMANVPETARDEYPRNVVAFTALLNAAVRYREGFEQRDFEVVAEALDLLEEAGRLMNEAAFGPTPTPLPQGFASTLDIPEGWSFHETTKLYLFLPAGWIVLDTTAAEWDEVYVRTLVDYPLLDGLMDKETIEAGDLTAIETTDGLLVPGGVTLFINSRPLDRDPDTFDLAGLIESSAAQVKAEGMPVFQAESGLMVTGRPAGVLRTGRVLDLPEGEAMMITHQVFIVGTGVHWILGFSYEQKNEGAALPVIEQIVASFRSKVEAWE